MSEKRVPVLYLDIDGTVREGLNDPPNYRFVNSKSDVQVFSEAVVKMQEWKDKGGRIVGVSNQGGIALGLVTPLQVAAAMLETQRQCENLFDKILWCQHHPDAVDPEMARCWCRKPRPGLVIEGAHALSEKHPSEIYPPHLALMVGDRDEDWLCAEAANVDFETAASWRLS